MATTTNPWLSPLQRSYQSIKSNLIQRMKTKVPEVTDYSEGNIFVILISIFAAIAEVIHYYIDNTARETFLPTARRMSSVVKHANQVDYNIKAANPASVDLVLYSSNGTPIPSDIIISSNTEFIDKDGIVWLSTKTIVWYANTYSVSVPVSEKHLANSDYIDFGVVPSGTIILEINSIPTGTRYVEGSMMLQVNGTNWRLVDTFAYSGPMDEVFKVSVNSDNIPVLQFGNGLFGKKPDIGSVLKGNYYLTTGALGNISAHSFNSLPSEVASQGNNLAIDNPLAASGGTDYEDFNTLKEHIPLSIKTLGVAITREDFEAITMLVPGVSKAYVNYICGRFVEIYITPDGGGVASQGLLDAVNLKVSKSKVITTTLSIASTKDIQIKLEATITGKPSFSSVDISNQVKKALIETYNFNSSSINKVIRLSDLYALMDNQSMVDYLKINKLYFIPNPVPYDYSNTPLNIQNYVQESYVSNGESPQYDYEVVDIRFMSPGWYSATTNSERYIGQVGVPLEVTGSRCKFNILIGQNETQPYVKDQAYSLHIQPMYDDITPYKYSLPILTSENITLSIHETV